MACETAVPAKTLETLRAFGHDLTLETPDNAFGFGGAQLIQRLLGRGYAGGSDPRKNGAVMEF